DVLGEAAVGLAAQQTDRIGVVGVGVVQRGVDQDSGAAQFGIDGFAGFDDDTSDVAALDAGEFELAPPTGRCRGVVGQSVSALPGPEVGVVHRCCADSDQRLAATGGGHADVVPHLQLLG